MSDEEPITILEIKIKRVITPQGEMTWEMTTPDQFSSIEVLGLLTAGQWSVFNELSKRNREI